MANTYCVAINTGEGFFTHEDRNNFFLEGHPANLWVVGNNAHGISWINRIEGTKKTKVDAQAILDTEIEAQQASWDAAVPEDIAPAIPTRTRPVKYTLP